METHTLSSESPLATSLITAAYLVPGQPHVLLAPGRSPGWQALHSAYGRVRDEIAQSEAEMILYFSTQWLTVAGYMFQADPAPEWVHVDANWHDLGSMPYRFRVEPEFAALHANEVAKLGFTTRLVAYRGFPVDTGTIVAQQLLNPDNRLPAAMVSCNMYAEKAESQIVGQAAAWALKHYGKRAAVVVVSNLSNRYSVTMIDPQSDRISSRKDDEWNRKILELLAGGGVEDVAQCAREFARQANADMGFKAIWWLNGLSGQHNDWRGHVYEYQSVWGTGCGVVGLTPKRPITATPIDLSALSEEGSQAAMVASLTGDHAP